MILTPDERSRRYVETGAWARVTLDQVFRRLVLAVPDQGAFADAGLGAVPGLAATLSYAEADRRVEALAAFFAGVGLRPDMVIGLHLPACADAAIVVLAALRAGLVVCPLPLHWTKGEIETAVQAASIRGIVTASEIEGEPSGELVRDVAADTFAIRFVFAVGRGMPDGLIDLAEVFADLDAFGAAPEVLRRGHAADHVALLSFARAADERLLVVPYTHNHLVAIARTHLIEGRIGRESRLLSTMHPAGLAGVGAGLAAGLIAGGTVLFHHPVTLAGFADTIAAAAPERVILPAVFAPVLDRVADPDVSLSLVSSGLDGRRRDALSGRSGTVDLVTLGGLCLLPANRDDRADHALPLVHLPAGDEAEGPIASLRLRAKSSAERRPGAGGELQLIGALIADSPWPEPASGRGGPGLAFTSDGYLRTGLTAEPGPDAASCRLLALPADTILVADRPLSARRLDALFALHPDVADAAVFPMVGPAGDSRLGLAVVARDGGSAPTLADLAAFLADKGAGSLDQPVFAALVDEIPRGGDGSVLRDALFLTLAA